MLPCCQEITIDNFKNITDQIDTSTPAGRFCLHFIASLTQMQTINCSASASIGELFQYRYQKINKYNPRVAGLMQKAYEAVIARFANEKWHN